MNPEKEEQTIHRVGKKTIQELELNDIDFNVVGKTTDGKRLKRFIDLLEEDKGFPDLLKATQDRLLEVDSKLYYKIYVPKATPEEELAVKDDLQQWQAEITKTDASLSSDVGKSTTKQNIRVAVRGKEFTAPVPLDPKEFQKTLKNDDRKPIKDYARDEQSLPNYYRKWDAVNVEEIEAKIEEEEVEKEKERQKTVEEQQRNRLIFDYDVPRDIANLQAAQRESIGKQEKNKGNECFYSKDFLEAIASYSNALKYLPEDPSIWANRSLARLKVSQYVESEEDSLQAIKLDAQYSKAWHRLGKARYEMQRFDDAYTAFRKAQNIDPYNQQINADLMLAKKKISAITEHEQAQKKSGSRVIIEEISDDEEEQNTQPTGGKKIMIEEDSEDDEEQDAPAKPTTTESSAPGFTRVQIEEESEESDPEIEEVTAPSKIEEVSSSPAKGFTRMQIEEESEDEAPKVQEVTSPKIEEIKTTPAAGFTRMQIEEESEDEAPKVQEVTSPKIEEIKTTPAAGFTRMHIEEESEDEAPKVQEVTSPKIEEIKTTPAAGFTRMQIEEESDDDGSILSPNRSTEVPKIEVVASSPKKNEAPKVEEVKKTPTTGFKRMQIEEDSKSDQESAKIEEETNDNVELIEPATAEGIDTAKKQATQFYLEKKPEDCIALLTRCLETIRRRNVVISQDQHSIVYSNRALAHISLEQWTEAERDANLAIKANDGNSKAYYRRFQSRLELKKYTDARLDYDLIAERWNVAMLESLRERLENEEKEYRTKQLKSPTSSLSSGMGEFKKVECESPGESEDYHCLDVPGHKNGTEDYASEEQILDTSNLLNTATLVDSGTEDSSFVKVEFEDDNDISPAADDPRPENLTEDPFPTIEISATVDAIEEGKRLGNIEFAQGNIDQAVALFSKSLWITRTQKLSIKQDLRVFLHSNRSLCYIHKEEWNLAYLDANDALTLNPENIKAKYRRSWALLELGRYDEAKEDCEKVVEKLGDGNNIDAVHLLDRISSSVGGKDFDEVPMEEVSAWHEAWKGVPATSNIDGSWSACKAVPINSNPTVESCTFEPIADPQPPPVSPINSEDHLKATKPLPRKKEKKEDDATTLKRTSSRASDASTPFMPAPRSKPQAPLSPSRIATPPSEMPKSTPLSPLAALAAAKQAQEEAKKVSEPKIEELPSTESETPAPSGDPYPSLDAPCTADGMVKAKSKGNTLFTQNAHAEAVRWFTKAAWIGTKCSVPEADLSLVYGNRALANLRLEKFEDALSDCSKSTELDSKNFKAFYRRATANYELNNDSEAMKDINLAISIKDNTEMQLLKTKILNRVQAAKIAAQKQQHDAFFENRKPKIPSVAPKTAQQFASQLNGLKKYPELLAQYLSEMITPIMISKLHQRSEMEPDITSLVIEGLSHFEDKARVKSYAEQIKLTKNADITLQMLSPSEMEKLNSLLL